jgi:hypothetical protein
MAEPRIPFARLCAFLSDLGFRQVSLSEAHMGFRRDDSDTLIAMPVYRPHEMVAPRHLVAVRVMLDNHGILDASDFDRRIAERPVRQSVS